MNAPHRDRAALEGPAWLRTLYQTTLVALQIALAVEIAPPVAQALQRGFTASAFPDSPLAAIQIIATLVAIVAGAVALAFPLLALLRHRQRGRARFGGLSRWAVALALTGAVAFAAGALLHQFAPLISAEARIAALLTARPLSSAGLAAMAAGVLSAELLRRSVGVPRVVVVARDISTHRIEVTHPPELATQLTAGHGGE